MTEDEILRQSAVAQAQLVRERIISSTELTEVYLDRIARLDGELHAFVEVFAEDALRAARQADRRGPSGAAPFFGVPTAIKDLNAVRGTFMRMGSRAFERLITPLDDFVVARLRRAGFIFLGKTSTSELGTMPFTEPDIHPPTRNPWDPRVTAGGSSGGAGAALAANLIPIGQGSDAGGSIRIPASFCGVVGFKPSRGVVENPFGLDTPDIIWTCGPLARSVDDAAAMLDVFAHAPPDNGGFRARSLTPLPKLDVRVATDVHIVTTSDEVRAAALRVAHIIEGLGHRLETAPKLSGVEIAEFLPIWQVATAQVPVADWSLTQPVTRWLGEAGRKLDPRSISAKLASISDRVLSIFGHADIWVTPTVANAPITIGALRNAEPLEVFHKAAELAGFTAPFNVTGQPAVTLPTGVSRDGHPIGVQLVGRLGEDAKVLALARAVEAHLDFRPLQLRPSPRALDRAAG